MTNLLPRVLNPFIRFTVGGTYCIEVLVLGDGKKKYIHSGKPGLQRITDVVSNLESHKSKLFRIHIGCQVKMSYNQLSHEHFHVEVWDKATWTLNTFLGYESILLADVANGMIKQQLRIFDKTEKNGVSSQEVCTLSLLLNFEEVWAFKLNFYDFRTTDLTDRNRPKDPSKELKPRLKIRLETNSLLKKAGEVVSSAQSNA